jgi:hypothetical protein
MTTTQKAYKKEWGDVWYNIKEITIIFSYSEMVARFRVTYYSDTKDTFKGLYVLKIGDKSQTAETQV